MNIIPKELDKAASEYAEETFRLRQSRDEDFPEASYYYEAFIKGFEFAKVKTPLKYKTIDAITSEEHVAYEGRSHTFEEAYGKFTFADGTPFGKLEGKE